MFNFLKSKIKKAEQVKPIDFFKSMGKLEIKDGDIIILKNSRRLSSESIIKIKERMEELISNNYNNEIIILDEGIDIGVIGKQDIKEK